MCTGWLLIPNFITRKFHAPLHRNEELEGWSLSEAPPGDWAPMRAIHSRLPGKKQSSESLPGSHDSSWEKPPPSATSHRLNTNNSEAGRASQTPRTRLTQRRNVMDVRVLTHTRLKGQFGEPVLPYLSRGLELEQC